MHYFIHALRWHQDTLLHYQLLLLVCLQEELSEERRRNFSSSSVLIDSEVVGVHVTEAMNEILHDGDMCLATILKDLESHDEGLVSQAIDLSCHKLARWE